MAAAMKDLADGALALPLPIAAAPVSGSPSTTDGANVPHPCTRRRNCGALRNREFLTSPAESPPTPMHNRGLPPFTAKA
jgi:hypothetical protein